MISYNEEGNKAIHAGGTLLLWHTVAYSNMVRAFIMVKTAAGKSADLQNQIRQMEEVLDAHVVAGQYDIIVEAEGDEVYTVIHTVATELHELDGVMDTRTYICLD